MTSETAAGGGKSSNSGSSRSFAFALFLVALFLLVGVILVSDGRRAAMPLLGPLVNGTFDLFGLSGAIFGFALAMIWSGRAFFTGRLTRWRIKVLGILGVVLSVCGLAGCGGESAGGLVGTLLAGRMVAFTGPFIAVTLFCFLLVGSFMLATNWLFYEEFRVLVKGGGKEGSRREARAEGRARKAAPVAPDPAGEYPIFRPRRREVGLENQVTPGEEAQLQGRDGVGTTAEPEEPAPTPGPGMDLAGAGPEESRPLADNLAGRRHRFEEEQEPLPPDAPGEALPAEDRAGGEEQDPPASPLAGRPHSFEDREEAASDPAPEEMEEMEEEEVTPSGQQFLWGAPSTELPRPDQDEPGKEPASPAADPDGGRPRSAADELLEEIEIPRPEPPADASVPDPELLSRAARLILESSRASTTILQRQLELDHGAAASLMEKLEELGLVGPYRGSLAREILMTREEWEALGVNHRS